MLNRYRLYHVAAGGCLIAVILITTISPIFSQVEDKPVSENQSAQTDREQPAANVPIIPKVDFWKNKKGDPENYRAVCDEPQSTNDADLCQQWRMGEAAEKQVYWTRLQFWATIFEIAGLLAVIVVSAWAAFAASAAASATHESTKLAAREFVATHPPRLILRLVRSYTVNPEMVPQSEISVANVGQSDAHILRIGADLALRKANWRIGEDYNATPQPLPENRVIKPGARMRLVATGTNEIDRYRYNRILGGDDTLCLIGRIIYADNNGIIRETGFFRVFEPHSERYVKDPEEDEYEYVD